MRYFRPSRRTIVAFDHVSPSRTSTVCPLLNDKGRVVWAIATETNVTRITLAIRLIRIVDYIGRTGEISNERPALQKAGRFAGQPFRRGKTRREGAHRSIRNPTGFHDDVDQYRRGKRWRAVGRYASRAGPPRHAACSVEGAVEFGGRSRSAAHEK